MVLLQHHLQRGAHKMVLKQQRHLPLLLQQWIGLYSNKVLPLNCQPWIFTVGGLTCLRQKIKICDKKDYVTPNLLRHISLPFYLKLYF